jgi:hypothetical protein
VRLKIEMKAKNHYLFLFGPSGQDGVLVIPVNEIIAEANRQLDMAIMDYCPIEESCTGAIAARIADSALLKQAINAMSTFGEESYPAEYRTGLEEAARRIMVKGVPRLVAQADGKNIAGAIPGAATTNS